MWEVGVEVCVGSMCERVGPVGSGCMIIVDAMIPVCEIKPSPHEIECVVL